MPCKDGEMRNEGLGNVDLLAIVVQRTALHVLEISFQSFSDVQVSGEIDQGAGMLSEDTIEKGYTLLCTATPKSDCVINCIEEVSPVSFLQLLSQCL